MTRAILHPDLQIKTVTLQQEEITCTVPLCLAERYEVTGLLAAGGFGFILNASDSRIFQRKVLLKANRYSPHLFQYPNDLARDRAISEQRERLEHEMKMLRVAQERSVAGTPILIDRFLGPSPQLYGPHRTAEGQTFALDPALCQNEPYLVLSYLEGEPLAQACLRKKFRQNLWGNAKNVAIKLSGLLHNFHQYKPIGDHKLSFIYQDLKPENIIWTSTREVMLIDFGSFAARTKDQVVPRNLFVSTLPYQPPEFAGGSLPEEALLPAADIFSLGVTMLHILRAEAPLDAQGLPALSLAGLDLPPAWRPWLEKMLAPDPRDRFQAMTQVRYDAFSLKMPHDAPQESTPC